MAVAENERLARVETRLASIEDAMRDIAGALTTLARIEQDNAHVKQALADQGRAITAIQAELPTMTLARSAVGWVAKAVGAAVLVAILASAGLPGK